MARQLFLERRTYRLNRLQDAARLLPVLGLVLIFGPIFIRGSGSEPVNLSATLVYYFAIWMGLIVLTALVSRALSRMQGLDDVSRVHGVDDVSRVQGVDEPSRVQGVDDTPAGSGRPGDG
ncbi:hypothetical protein [Gymnodinialimonas ulvae]|uniref:hypothetical protein n=1 Tax=Gymnodinialimonas ulvae TaxID=3126504 RepID=UPI0030A3428D